jgi:hypothetical protein
MVNIAPYLWFPTVNMGLNYDLPGGLGGKLPTDVSAGPGDILAHLDIGAMLAADVRNGPYSLLSDFIYTRFSATTSNVRIKSVNFAGLPSIPIDRSLQTSTGTTLRVAVWTLAGGYTVLQRDWGNVDLIGGLRFLYVNSITDFNLALTITGPRGNGATFGGIGSVSVNRDVWNGIAGVRGRIRVGDTQLFFPYYFDIGAGGSKLTWQIAGGLGYQMKWGAVSATYRYLSFQQHSGATVDNLRFRGPLVMVNFTF